MNKPVTSADLVTPKVTTGSLPASRKVYCAPDAAPDLRVPVRETLGQGMKDLSFYKEKSENEG